VVTSSDYPPYLAAEVVDVLSNGILVLRKSKQDEEEKQEAKEENAARREQQPQPWNQKMQQWFGNPLARSTKEEGKESNSSETVVTKTSEAESGDATIAEKKEEENDDLGEETVDFEPHETTGSTNPVAIIHEKQCDGAENCVSSTECEVSATTCNSSKNGDNSDPVASALIESSTAGKTSKKLIDVDELNAADISPAGTMATCVILSKGETGNTEPMSSSEDGNAIDESNAMTVGAGLPSTAVEEAAVVTKANWVDNFNSQRQQLLARFQITSPTSKEQQQQLADEQDPLQAEDIEKYTKVVFLQYGSFEEGARGHHCLVNTIELKHQMNPQIHILMGGAGNKTDKALSTMLTEQQLEILMKKLFGWSRTFKRKTKSVRNKKAEMITNFGSAAAVGSIVVFAVGGLIFAGPELALLSALGAEAIETTVLAAACGIAYKLTSHAAEKTWFWSQPFISLSDNAKSKAEVC
jgi:hypothetical protein